MKKNLLNAALASVLAIGLTGCLEIKKLTPQEIVAGSKDKQIAQAVIDNLKDKKYSINYNINRIIISQNISTETGSMSHSPDEAVSTYLSKYDSSTDQIANTYITMAKERGNTVKLYKNSVNLAIAEIMPMPWEVKNRISKANIDNTLVEYDKNNRSVSALIRVHTMSKSLGYIHDRFSMIVFDNLARTMETTIQNSVFDNGYITTLGTK